MKIGIVSDHRGYETKKKILKEIKNISFIDYGTNSKESVDYPDYAFKLGKAINKKEVDLGIAICGSGIGMSIALNKVKGIRCARVTSIKDVVVTKIDNNSNVIAFSSDINFNKIKRMIEEFINTPFSTDERHVRRVNKIKEYESKN
ncbi:MAG: RpiB/LacA/LacB family sugar-phosphate isomerase [Bacilli bacterium]|nr:RpiB/LacA/LacB family sugar-phosphate isomerase [Bacilli bacterium]